MSVKASGSTTLTLVPELGTFNPYLVCDKGELWQDYEGSATAPTKYMPDFSATGQARTLTLYVSSSRAGANETPVKVTFYLNNVEIGSVTQGSGPTYSKTMSTTQGFSTTFELLDPTQNAGNYGLRIKDNLVPLTGGVSGQIVAEFIVSDGTTSATMRTDIWFAISEMTSNGSKVVIEAGDTNNFQITEKTGAGSSAKLMAVFYRDGVPVTAGLSYEWYRQAVGQGTGDLANWEKLTVTSQTLTVTETDVESARLYMVRVFEGSDPDKVMVGQDTQRVDDRSDDYMIVITRNPPDGQVHKDTDSVELTAGVVLSKSGNAVTLPGTAQWTFIGTSPGGTPIFTRATSSTPGTTVTYSEINNAGGQLEVMAVAEF